MIQPSYNPFEALFARFDGLEHRLAALVPAGTSAAPTEIINREELCRRLNITEPTIIRWEKKGKIPVIRIGSAVRYNWYHVLEALENKKEVKK